MSGCPCERGRCAGRRAEALTGRNRNQVADRVANDGKRYGQDGIEAAHQMGGNRQMPMPFGLLVISLVGMMRFF